METLGVTGERETEQIQDEAAIGPQRSAGSCSSNLHTRIVQSTGRELFGSRSLYDAPMGAANSLRGG
jgi:hypothetical protein